MADFHSMRSACAEAKGGRIKARSKGEQHGHTGHPKHGVHKRARGGAVGFADGGSVEGDQPKQRNDRKPAKGNAKININVISPPAPAAAPPAMARPPIPMPAPGGPPGLGAAPPPRPMMPPGGMPPGAGMPPPGAAPPMRPPGMKRGGRMEEMTAGAASGEGRLEKSRAQKREMRVE